MYTHSELIDALDPNTFEADTLIYEVPPPKRNRYDDAANNTDTIKREPKLEPIENAGGLRLHLFRQDPLPFVKIALEILDGNWIDSTTPRTLKQQCMVARIPAEELLANGIASRVQRGNIKNFMHVFTRQKQNGKCRIIGHPATLNEVTKPPNINLTSLTTLMGSLSDIIKPTQTQHNESSDLHFTEIDFKNYFPQIPLPQKIWPYFGFMAFDNHGRRQCFQQKVLTQGWNMSPFIAQALTWACILRNVPQQALVEHLPGLLHLTEPEGETVIVVVYDNILVASNSSSLSEKWKTHIVNNTKYFNITTKYVTSTTNECVFCGLEIRVNHSQGLHWRTKEETFSAWKLLAGAKYDGTAREVLKIAGIICRQAYVAQQTPAYFTEALTLSRQVLQEMAASGHVGWDTQGTYKDTTAQIATLLNSMDNDWKQLPPDLIAARNTVILVTDATPTKTCFIHIDAENFTILGDAVTTDIEACEICEAELTAVLHGVCSLQKQACATSLVLVIDNQAAGRALAKGYMLGPHDRLVKDIRQQAHSRNLNLTTVIDIPTSENLADIGTRGGDFSGKEAETRRLQTLDRLRTCMRLHKAGTKYIPRGVAKTLENNGESVR